MTPNKSSNPVNAKTVDAILNKALGGEDISPEEGVALLKQTEPAAIEAIRATADALRRQQAGQVVTFVINRNINFTNICEQHCNFCAFRRDAGDRGAYWLDWGQIQEKATDAIARGATEICMQGGLNPKAKEKGTKEKATSLSYYRKLVRTIKDKFPQLHLHAFSPQEVQFIAREDNLTYPEAIAALRDAGVDSMPGTAAEVLDDRLRRVICPEKIDAATWLEIVSAAHRLGMPTTSTMLCGHIETPEQQIGHLRSLRNLQKTARDRGYPAEITEFILLPFVGEKAPAPLRRRVGRDQPILADSLLLTAVARIFLGRWIANHQPSWVKLGLAGATEALNWGCNDLGGTLMEESITTMAGARGGSCLEVSSLQAAIRQVGRPYAQRDTLYRHLREG